MLDAIFHAVDLHLFDVHTAIRPLISSKSLQPKFQFLVQPEAYRKQYAEGKSLLTDSFDFHPLSKSVRAENCFWKNYLQPNEEAAADYWALQSPFICSVRQPIIRLTDDANFNGRVRPFIRVSALGWSSNLSIHLRGTIKLSDLLEFMFGITGNAAGQKQLGGASESKPSRLSLEGKPATVSAIFKDLAQRLLKEVYDPNDPPKTGSPQLPSHSIISLSKFEGPMLDYQKTIWRKGMTNAEQAIFHSLLRGELIDVKQLAHKLRNPSPTIIRFDPAPDFMLVYFQYGALAFMQQSAVGDDQRQRSLSCVASNISSYSNIIWTLYHFYHKTQGTTNNSVKDLRAQVGANLRAMRETYISQGDLGGVSIRYAKAFFQHHETLKTLLAKPN